MEQKDKKKKILIVEDEIALSEVLSSQLKRHGFEVQTAGDGEAGYEAALSMQPDLVLADIVMPKMDGVEMVVKLRASDGGKDIKVVFLTNLSDIAKLEKMTKEGYQYMVKSDFGIEEIVDKINEFLKE